MPIECPQCKSPVARDGQRFCYRCGHDLNSYYDSLSIKVKDLSPESTPPPGPEATQVLSVESTASITDLAKADINQKATLRILLPTGDVFDREIPSTEVQLGKGPRNDIVIADPAVSTAHASIGRDGKDYIITDLGSRNGTFVNAEKIGTPHKLSHGDVIGMGLSRLTFRIAGYSETGVIRAEDLRPAAKVSGPPPLTEESLAKALVEQAIVAQSDIDRLRGSDGLGRRLCEALVKEGIVAETKMAEVLCSEFQLPRIDLHSTPVDEEIAIAFSSRIARDRSVFAFGKHSGVLLLAMADPTDTAAVSKVEVENKSKSAVHVATFGEIAEQIEKYYGPKLIGVLPSGEKLRFPINQQDVEIGKASHNHIVLNDPTVSNTHAALMARDGGYSIVDLGSRNGTFINGERLGGQSRTLRHGDSIQLGQTVLTFRNSGETTENVTATLSAAALEEVRRRAAAMATPDTALPMESVPVPPSKDADSPGDADSKKKKKKKKGGTDERLRAAYVSGASRIVAQVLGVVLAVLLALYVNSSMKSGSDKPILETSGKGKAKVKVAKVGDGTAFSGGVYEASAVVQPPGSDGVYFVDDSKPGEILYMPLDQSGQQSGDIKPIEFGAAVADPEGITYGGSFFYVIGSQAHKEAGDRNALARFALDAGSQTVQGNPELLSDFRGFLIKNVPELAPFTDTKGNEGGINIEGLSWDPLNDRLLVGLRSPVIDGKAMVVPIKYKDPRGGLSADNLSVGSPIMLAIGGQGIRDIQYDSRGNVFLVIAGAPNHGESAAFSLWEWGGDPSADSLHEMTKLDGRIKPEGVARVKIGSKEFLFVVGDGSRYMKLDLASE